MNFSFLNTTLWEPVIRPAFAAVLQVGVDLLKAWAEKQTGLAPVNSNRTQSGPGSR